MRAGQKGVDTEEPQVTDSANAEIAFRSGQEGIPFEQAPSQTAEKCLC